MTFNKTILTDADGVLLDWEHSFHAWMKDQGHKRVQSSHDYWQELQYPQLTQAEAKKHIYYFNTSAWMLGMIPFRDARIGVARLVDAGHNFHVISAMGTDKFSKLARQINLETIFGKEAVIKLTTTDIYDPDSKKEVLTGYDKNTIWIEDKLENAKLGNSLGLTSILLDHPYNQYENNKDIERVNSWNDICDFIL